MQKVEVNGPNTCEVYKYLRGNSSLNIKGSNDIREIPWNFAKFLADRNGIVVSYHNPRVDPLELVPEIEKILAS